MALVHRGGKKKRRGKNLNLTSRQMEYITEDQNYGQITKVLGSGRFMTKCYTQTKNGNFDMIEIVCKVRGKMRKRVYVNNGDIVIVAMRDFQDNKGDIVHKYTYDEANSLKKQQLLPKIELIKNNSAYTNDEINFEDEDEDEDTNKHDMKKQLIKKTYNDLDIMYESNSDGNDKKVEYDDFGNTISN
jgi:translation initiation factor 1A